MGMFDNIKFRMACPVCGRTMSNFQSKGGDCLMNMLSPKDVENFYSSCDTCNTWVEFDLVTHSDGSKVFVPTIEFPNKEKVRKFILADIL